MKNISLVIILILILSLTGCIKEYTYTEEQTDIYGEYIAGTLLASDENYNSKLISFDDIKEKEGVESILTPTPIPTPTSTHASPIPTPTWEGSFGEDDTNNIEDYTLNEVIALESFNVQYNGYKLQETYPENFMDAYFSITPSAGKQLLVLSFIVENTSNKESDINLVQPKVNYEIHVGNSNIHKPMLTLLENDLQYIDLIMDAGERETALLIFEVSNDIDMDDVKLGLSKDDKAMTMPLN